MAKKELWERWRAGESISDIARALQKPPGSIHGMLEATRGMSPPQRRRRRCALTPTEREEISRGLATGESLRAIATQLGRCASTMCREVNRNGGRRNYRAAEADERASKRARRPKRCLLTANHFFLRDVVARKLREDWSPEQISGWLKKEYPSDEAMYISHETIYRTLSVQARGTLRRELLAHLRSRRMMRKGRHASTKGQPRGQIKVASLTWDRGPEMAAHKSFTVATDVCVYFCDPKSAWQRGTSENANRPLRQYLPRRTDLSVYSQHDLDLIAQKHNSRPRKTLGYSTPAATLTKTVAFTG